MRRPKTLWLAMARETLRLTLLTALLCTVVIAFVAALPPYAQGRIGPFDALRYMTLAAPAMAQFVLPFAAGFGATLAHHRLAADNELVAAVAAGISRGALLAPAVFCGLVLALVLALSANFVIPRTLLAMERLVRKDAASLLVNAVEKGEAAELGDVRIHADDVVVAQRDPSGDERLTLTGFVALVVDPETGAPKLDIAAQVADVALRHAEQDGQPVVLVAMRLSNVVAKRQGEVAAVMDRMEPAPWIVPSPVADDPKFLTLPGLLRLMRDPASHPASRARRRALASALALESALQSVREQLAAQGRLDLQTASGQPLALRASGASLLEQAPQAEGDTIALALEPLASSGRVQLQWRDPQEGLRVAWASAATLTIASSVDQPAATLSLTMQDVQLRGADGLQQPLARKEELVRNSLRLARDPAAQLTQLDDAALQARARETVRNAARPALLARRLAKLERTERRLRRAAMGNLHQRAALSLACAVMALAGAATAMLLAQAGPLIVYLWSFLPSLLGVIAISGGENTVEEHVATGLITLWSGVALVGLFALAMFLRVRRH
ncbi:MAG: LptF/LptG family permease [Planctomycetota bacterium]|nr:MAG: LptF/LptG family permease [Planctomycetota bacterium]